MSPSRRPKSRKGSVGQASLASAHGGSSPWNTDMLLVQARQKMMKKKRDRSTNSAGDSGPSSEQDSVDGKAKNRLISFTTFDIPLFIQVRPSMTPVITLPRLPLPTALLLKNNIIDIGEEEMTMGAMQTCVPETMKRDWEVKLAIQRKLSLLPNNMHQYLCHRPKSSK